MQIVHNSSQLIPLLALIPLHLANATTVHLIILAGLILINPSPIQNYCNAAISIVFILVLILMNLQETSQVIFALSGNDLLEMHIRVVSSLSFWIFLCQGVCLLVWLCVWINRYRQWWIACVSDEE